MHAEHLEATFGVGPHTISVPRIRRADDIDPAAFDNGINDDVFAKLVACIRKPGTKNYVRCTTNPNGPGKNWVCEYFIG